MLGIVFGANPFQRAGTKYKIALLLQKWRGFQVRFGKPNSRAVLLPGTIRIRACLTPALAVDHSNASQKAFPEQTKTRLALRDLRCVGRKRTIYADLAALRIVHVGRNEPGRKIGDARHHFLRVTAGPIGMCSFSARLFPALAQRGLRNARTQSRASRKCYSVNDRIVIFVAEMCIAYESELAPSIGISGVRTRRRRCKPDKWFQLIGRTGSRFNEANRAKLRRCTQIAPTLSSATPVNLHIWIERDDRSAACHRGHADQS